MPSSDSPFSLVCQGANTDFENFLMGIMLDQDWVQTPRSATISPPYFGNLGQLSGIGLWLALMYGEITDPVDVNNEASGPGYSRVRIDNIPNSWGDPTHPDGALPVNKWWGSDCIGAQGGSAWPGYTPTTSMAWGNGVFVVVYPQSPSVYTSMGYSKDGKSWSECNISASDNAIHWRSVAYGNGVFVATGRLYDQSTPGSARVARSLDGVNWTVSSNYASYPLDGVISIGAMTYGNFSMAPNISRNEPNGCFLALAQVAPGLHDWSPASLLVSRDGITWFTGYYANGGGGNYVFKSVACANDNVVSGGYEFMAVTAGSTSYLAVAGSDGSWDTSWGHYDNSSGGPIDGYNWNDVVRGAGYWYIVGEGGILRSSTGKLNDWTVVVAPVAGVEYVSVSADGGNGDPTTNPIIAVTKTGDIAICSSSDAMTFELIPYTSVDGYNTSDPNAFPFEFGAIAQSRALDSTTDLETSHIICIQATVNNTWPDGSGGCISNFSPCGIPGTSIKNTQAISFPTATGDWAPAGHPANESPSHVVVWRDENSSSSGFGPILSAAINSAAHKSALPPIRYGNTLTFSPGQLQLGVTHSSNIFKGRVGPGFMDPILRLFTKEDPLETSAREAWMALFGSAPDKAPSPSIPTADFDGLGGSRGKDSFLYRNYIGSDISIAGPFPTPDEVFNVDSFPDTEFIWPEGKVFNSEQAITFKSPETSNKISQAVWDPDRLGHPNPITSVSLSMQAPYSGFPSPSNTGFGLSKDSGHMLFTRKDGSLWGSGQLDELNYLGFDPNNFDASTPLLLVDPKGNKPWDGVVVSMCAGPRCSFWALSDGSLWGVGFNEYGQFGLGQGAVGNIFSEPMEIVSPQDTAGQMKSYGVKKVVTSGYGHTLFTLETSSGTSLFGMGHDEGWGCLGQGGGSPGPVQDYPDPVNIFGGTSSLEVFDCAAGGLHEEAQPNQHVLYGFSVFSVYNKAYTNIYDPATGVTFKKREYTVLAMGSNMRGQIGQGFAWSGSNFTYSTQFTSPRQVVFDEAWSRSDFDESFPGSGGSGVFPPDPDASGTATSGNEHKVYSSTGLVAAGGAHALAHTTSFDGSTPDPPDGASGKEGRLWAWGLGTDGQLGQDDDLGWDVALMTPATSKWATRFAPVLIRNTNNVQPFFAAGRNQSIWSREVDAWRCEWLACGNGQSFGINANGADPVNYTTAPRYNDRLNLFGPTGSTGDWKETSPGTVWSLNAEVKTRSLWPMQACAAGTWSSALLLQQEANSRNSPWLGVSQDHISYFGGSLWATGLIWPQSQGADPMGWGATSIWKNYVDGVLVNHWAIYDGIHELKAYGKMVVSPLRQNTIALKTPFATEGINVSYYSQSPMSSLSLYSAQVENTTMTFPLSQTKIEID